MDEELLGCRQAAAFLLDVVEDGDPLVPGGRRRQVFLKLSDQKLAVRNAFFQTIDLLEHQRTAGARDDVRRILARLAQLARKRGDEAAAAACEAEANELTGQA